jgi:glycosyltransferase involved in cell wall biosynthesis
MKIVVTGLRGIPGVIGGVEAHCEELLPRVAERLPEAEIEVCTRSAYIAEKGSFRGVTIRPLPAMRGSSSETLSSTLLGVLHAYRTRADILHIHAVGPALLTPLARLLGMRVVVTIHGADYKRSKFSRFGRMILRLGASAAIRFAHRVICVSSSLRDELAEEFPAAAERLVHIPNGAATLPPSPVSDGAYLDGLGVERGGYLLTVGRLDPGKGFAYLIKAHALSGTPHRLLIAGSEVQGSGHRQELVDLAGERVMLLGDRSRAELGVLYRNTALFVFPSFHEGLPIVALEAMASGAPILLSNIPANRELGLQSKHYFPVGDVEALSKALSIDPVQYTLETSGKPEKYEWGRIADQTVEVYRSLARAAA